MEIYQVYSVPFNSFGAKFQTTFVVCFFYFNKLSFGKTFICKVKRLNVKQRRSRWDGSLSHLIWIYAVCKSLLLSSMAVKELRLMFPSNNAFCTYKRAASSKQCLRTCTEYADSDHPAHAQSIIGALLYSYIIYYPIILLVMALPDPLHIMGWPSPTH